MVEEVRPDGDDEPAAESSGVIDEIDQELSAPVEERRSLRRRLRSSDLSPVRLALVFGLATVVALVSLCGWLGYRTHQQRQTDQFRALLVQVARQGAINLTTIDHATAEADVQRILDSATGEFAEDFKNRSGPFIDVVKKVQSKSVGTVTEAGLESATGREGQVLVAVTVKSSSKGTPDEQPRYWRMRLTVAQQEDGVKVSKVDFVP